MKILTIADKESAYLWDYFEKSKLEGIDLILSCGDLDPHYLSFLATFTTAPVLYVCGNHDEKYAHTLPEGCIVLKTKFMCTKEYAFWDWEVPCVIQKERISTQSGK